MRLQSLTRPELIFSNLTGSDGPTVLRALADRVAERGLVKDADRLYRRLWEREKLGSTGLGSGVAVPHCKVGGLDAVTLAIGICPRGVDFDASDGEPVKVLFLVLSPRKAAADHLHALAAISKWVKAEGHVERILKLDDAEAIFDLLDGEG